MTKIVLTAIALVSLSALSCAQRQNPNQPARPDAMLVDFSCPSSQQTLQIRQGSARLEDDAVVLEIAPDSPGSIRLVPPEGSWDGSGYSYIAVNMENLSANSAHIRCFVANENATGWSNSTIVEGALPAGRQKDIKAFLYRNAAAVQNYPPLNQFQGMSGLPGGFLSHWHTIDPADIRYIDLTIEPTEHTQRIALRNVRAARYLLPQLLADDKEAFFPFIDGFGQYAHDDWPGKTHSVEDLRDQKAEELRDLADNPGPESFNKYGGYKHGPKLQATGHFRTEKIDGFWWLVDPEGRLFWSSGSNSVNPAGANTRITEREHYFDKLPPDEGSYRQFYHSSDDGQTQHVDFLGYNRYRKYGPDWRQHTRLLNHRRIRSWGMNTLAAWSEQQTQLMRKTPYTAIIHPWSDRITPRTPDPFADNFETNLANALEAQAGETAKDPWCIGYFIDNELEWYNPDQMLEMVLTADAALAAKNVLIGDLEDKYGTIGELNSAWRTNFDSFQQMIDNTDPVQASNAGPDAVAFYRKMLDTYFRISHEQMRRIAPNKLYLGARFHKHNDYILEAAQKYCDVISYNLYRFSMEGFSLANVDKPVMSTEFHFGALDRGMLSTGLKGASDQHDRAYLLERYLRTALENPNMVGAHWFTFNSQPTTGRGDGENYQIGLVDICDSPYPETIATLRRIGDAMYRIRLQSAEGDQQ